MKYYYTQEKVAGNYAIVYTCNHPFYSKCTLYLKDGKGLAVVCKKYDKSRKVFYYDRINYSIANDIYLQDGFSKYFEEHSANPVNDIYPTVELRSIMWALRMRPLRKEWWEGAELNSAFTKV